MSRYRNTVYVREWQRIKCLWRNSKKQSSYPKSDVCSAGQENCQPLRNLEVHYRLHYDLYLVSWIQSASSSALSYDPIHVSFHLRLGLPCSLLYSEFSTFLPRACYIPHLPLPLWFVHSNNIRVQWRWLVRLWPSQLWYPAHFATLSVTNP
jgi:hypothetical protein